AIFAGRPPSFFPDAIMRMGAEARLWARFWAEEGFPAGVGYANVRGEPGDLTEVERELERPDLRALGIVVRKVDEIMHGMRLGSAGMHNQVAQWASEGFPAALLERLLRHGFHVFITADHGNVEARGMGRLAEGVLAEERGERT